MQGSSNNSFIPKRRNSKRQRSKPARKIFLITILAYSVLFAALLAAAGTVFYKNFVETQLEQEVVALDQAVNTFSVQDFKQVQEYDNTLQQAASRINNTASIVAILDGLDQITARPIQIEDLQLERQGDTAMSVILTFTTQTLDVALFQRRLLAANSAVFTDLTISEVDLQSAVEATAPDEIDQPPQVTFRAEFTTPITSILYDPQEARRTDLGVGQIVPDFSVANIEQSVPDTANFDQTETQTVESETAPTVDDSVGEAESDNQSEI